MRTQRFLVSLLTIALIGLVPLGFATPAEAAKSKREVSATGKQGGRDFFLLGKVKGAKRVQMQVQRRPNTAKGGGWKSVRKIRTNAQGKYQFSPEQRIGQSFCYRFVIPGNKKFKKTFRATYTYGKIQTPNGPVPRKGLPMCIKTVRVS